MSGTKHSHDMMEEKIFFVCNPGASKLPVRRKITDGDYEVFRKDFSERQKSVEMEIPVMGAREKQFFIPDCNIPNIS